MILADKIIDLRKKNGWSQEELAERLGVSRQAVSKWEGAQSVPDMALVLPWPTARSTASWAPCGTDTILPKKNLFFSGRAAPGFIL